MSGETEDAVSGWKPDQLHPHLESKIDGLEKLMNSMFSERELRYSQRFQAQEEGRKDLAKTTDDRFFSHNEFRKEARERDNLFATKIEVQGLNDILTDLKERLSRVETLREGQTKALMGMITVVGLVLVLINIALAFLGR